MARRPAARPVKIFLNPGVWVPQEVLHRIDLDLLVDQDGDTVADSRQAVQIMGDHEDRQPQALLQAADQLVEGGRADRIEAGRRLVQEQQFGVEGKRPGQPRPLLHAAGELGRELCPGIGRQAGHGDLQGRQLRPHMGGQMGMLLQRHDHIVRQGQGAEQSPALE